MDEREKRLRRIRKLEAELGFAPPAKAAKITGKLAKYKGELFKKN